MPEDDLDRRLTALEGQTTGMEERLGRMIGKLENQVGGLEGRLSSLAAAQSGHELSLMRIAAIQDTHTARFDGIDKALADILSKL
jgi:hypothetical protein